MITISNNKRHTKPPIAKGAITEYGSVLLPGGAPGGIPARYFVVHDTGEDKYIRVALPDAELYRLLLGLELVTATQIKALLKP